MILASLGKFSVAQALTAGATDSTNVMERSAIDYNGPVDLWLNIVTNVAAGGSGTLTFDLVLAQEAALTNVVSVVRIYAASEADLRCATAGRNITAINIGKVIKDMLHASGSDYEFIGMIYTLGSSATITIDAALSPSEPQTDSKRMSTVSNVTVPGVASAGSGA